MKTILVTGASKGIGYETALALLDLGHRVIATARSQDKLEALKKESGSELVYTIAADLTSEKGIRCIHDEVSSIGNLDAIINNAGLVLNKPFMETSKEEWQKVFDVNLFAPIHLIKSLKANINKGAHIVNIGSMGGFQGSEKFPGLAAYSAAKGSLAILTESLSIEFSEDRIAVNCLCLGAVQTEMLSEAFPGYEAPVQPNEMGQYLCEFTLNAHKFMNGKIIPVSLNNPQ
jgi:short-subunit dehydrogenase